LGAEAITYSVSWNTVSVPNGSYTLTAVAPGRINQALSFNGATAYPATNSMFSLTSDMALQLG
jgi:hypothetical protein